VTGRPTPAGMWLVLGQDGDPEAGWIADGLRARADRQVELIPASTLVHGCRWEHRIGGRGTSSRLLLHDNTVVDSATVHGVVNRLCWLGSEGYTGASPADREYANVELYALGLSWLESLGPRVLNRPDGTGLAGPWRSTGQWRALARSVGLPIVPHHSEEPEMAPGDDSDRVVLVIDGQVIDPGGTPELMPGQRDGLCELQRVSGLDLLETHLAVAEETALRSVSFLPSMSRFGEFGLDALHQALTRRCGAGR
jgi:hypothetical protein